MDINLIIKKKLNKIVFEFVFASLWIIVTLLLYLKSNNIIILILLGIFPIVTLLSEISSYIFIRKIKNTRSSDSEQINFFNNQNCVFTEKNILLWKKRKIISYEYSELKSIYREICYTRRGAPDILYMNFNKKETYKIKVYANAYFENKIDNIEKYLVNKNNSIEVDETIVNLGVIKL